MQCNVVPISHCRFRVSLRRPAFPISVTSCRVPAPLQPLKLLWKFQLICRVQLGLQLNCLNRRAFEAQGLGAVAAFSACALYLKRTGQGFRVVLQGDDALGRSGFRVG